MNSVKHPKITSHDKLVHYTEKIQTSIWQGMYDFLHFVSSHSIEVKAVLNKDVLILTPLGPAIAAAYLQYQQNKIDK